MFNFNYYGDEASLMEGMHSASIGNNKFGCQLVVRNLNSKEMFCRRYIRFIMIFMGAKSIFEFRFANSI